MATGTVKWFNDSRVRIYIPEDADKDRAPSVTGSKSLTPRVRRSSSKPPKAPKGPEAKNVVQLGQ